MCEAGDGNRESLDSFHGSDLKTLINKGNSLEMTLSAVATEKRDVEEVSICLVLRTTALNYAILGFPVCLPYHTSPWQAGD